MRRREDIYRFYYLEIGSAIRKKRLENNLTQEELAKGICSNTYLSKIEHNAIAVNKDSLFMIMERINMSTEEYGFPEEMVQYMDQSLNYFFKGDIERYQYLYEDSMQYQFGILVEISRFGYYVLQEDWKSAGVVYDELHRYLCAVEDYGFTIFILYACFYNILICDYETARQIYEDAKDFHSFNQQVYALFEYAKFIIYSRLGFHNSARDGYENAKNIFFSLGASNRMYELSFYLNLFKSYEGSETTIDVSDSLLSLVSIERANEYVFIKSLRENQILSLQKIKPNTPYYPESLYFQARNDLKMKNHTGYDDLKRRLKDYYSNHVEDEVNYLEMLDFVEKKQLLAFKDYLIAKVLPFVSKRQNIIFMTFVTDEISTILSESKRYKDAISYQYKLDKSIQKMKSLKK